MCIHSGTNSECVTNNIDNAWAPLATWLRQNKRQAINTETGGGNTASCAQFLCEQIAFVQQNSDGEFMLYACVWAIADACASLPRLRRLGCGQLRPELRPRRDAHSEWQHLDGHLARFVVLGSQQALSRGYLRLKMALCVD